MRFKVYIAQDYLRRTSLGRIISRILWEFGLHVAGLGKKAPQSNAQFLDFLEDYPERPFFVLINYMDVNQALHYKKLNHPFWVPKPSMVAVADAYDDGLRQLDDEIGNLFAKLEQLENTLVVITSDHGESFGALETEDHDPEGHGTSLYVEQVRVPLFIVFPGKVPAGQRNYNLVTLRQIPSTIASLLGEKNMPVPGDPLPVTGDQFVTISDEPSILTTLNYDENIIQSVIWGEWHYLDYFNHPTRDEELYDLMSDPLEKRNLAPADPNLAQGRNFLRNLMGEENLLASD